LKVTPLPGFPETKEATTGRYAHKNTIKQPQPMKKLLLLTLMAIQLNVFCQGNDHDFIITDTIQSKFLNQSKVIRIYLPPDYYHANDSYPLQVVLGGYSRTRLYYSMNEYLSKTYQILDLNHLHTVPETIIVGLSTAPSNDFNNFRKFISLEVIPHIETKYRKTNYKTLVGHSSDGEFVLRNLFHENSPFQSYFCTAPTNSEYFINLLEKGESRSLLKKATKKLYMGASKQDYFYDGNKRLIEAFQHIEVEKFRFKSSIKETDTHHTIFPVLLTEALFFIYEDWHFSLPKSTPGMTTELFINHYKDLSQQTGMEIVPPEFDFYLLAYMLDARKHTNEKIKLLKKCKELYPEAVNADAYLARTYYMIGDLKRAKKYNGYALASNPNSGFAKQTKVLIEKRRD